ncbi:MAG: hypothetical protein PVF38_17135 [Desulfobacterales bacterium]|jgi:hypothetical protein
MLSNNHLSSAAVLAIAGVCLVLVNLACSSRAQTGRQAPGNSGGDTAGDSASVIWAELLQKTPFPHTAPLPSQEPTVMDGTYTKLDPKKTPPVPCRRCPDYVPEGGIWKLHLSKGVFRIFHEFTGWRSIGSFTVEANRVQLFNDPTCIEVTGTYTWTLKAGRLNWVVVQDECAIGMRAKNLTQQPWLSCQPPSMKANWEKPPGCD